ncbi:unnamed protein product [[Actinomadura] parvosata subsp. kistnae]|uniref:Uncharacterized protein n=1 Tax=[Actinomadura] parvosata subsp. kistnae TaxID=1909395 RepID=A0A1V0A613_9ACTN|nr:hypothetical protein [Nonomuraea sp. ATCC 55076]AQZ65630.1 hypothetical protein BKM31_32960 [Nonomuraea sp. ATCC 55076]SPL97013.1 unnamed protein product [Actinomadura parvosata subsp. kistnae]
MRGIINVVAVIAVIQGLVGFAGRMWFDSEWGFLHRLVELPLWGYPVVAVAGLVALVLVDASKKREQG